MSDRPTIILAPFDANVAADLACRVPAAQVGALDAITEEVGPLWLFVDWLLPESSGLELCRRLRAALRNAEAHIFLVIEDDDR
jgi:two-component system phosphate regulon response regulator PhoB